MIFIFIGLTLMVVLAVVLLPGQENGIKNIMLRKIRRRDENIERILSMFEEQDQITNHDIEKLLGVSGAAAISYMDELEQQGLVRQHTDGSSSYYTRN